jgi:hypothetical protein
VIRGKNMPKELCMGGKNFSIIISNNCTLAAITIIKIRYETISACAGIKIFQYIGQLIIAVRVTTKITEAPIPTAVLKFLEMTINGHIPKMYTKAILWVNIDAIKIFKGSIN